MKTVWKFEIGGEISIEIPQGAKILKVDTQNDKPVIWALVDPKNPVEKRKFVMYGTGSNIRNDHIEYVGTIFSDNKIFVFHVFEVICDKKDGH